MGRAVRAKKKPERKTPPPRQAPILELVEPIDPDEIDQIAQMCANFAEKYLEQKAAQEERERGCTEKFAQYRNDPVGYIRDVLGVNLWESEDPKQHGQADVARAIGEFDRVAVKSGHKIGKSVLAVGLALWFASTRDDARVLLTAPAFHQVKNILWRELTMLFRRRSLSTVFGVDLPKDPATGLKLTNGSEIFGISASNKENLAGISGAEMLFIVDESSGYPDDLWETLSSGNAAGGVKIFCISNPTRTSGWFFNLFRKKSKYWRLFTISSENTPNVRSGEKLIPGVAEREFIERMRDECGPDWMNDPVYMVRIRGEFPPQGSDAVIALWLVERAIARWSADATPQAAHLVIGVDVGRFGGDPSVIQPVRGLYAHMPTAISGADGPTVAAEVIRVASELRISSERVRVNVDGIGVGASVVDALKYSDPVQDGWLYLCDLNVGEAGDDENHEKLRDQVWFSCAEWLKEGGAIPEHEQLGLELLAATYSFTIRNKKKVEAKDKMRVVLGRSPDYADALCLATYRGPRGAIVDYSSFASCPDDRHPAVPGQDTDWGKFRGGGSGSDGGTHGGKFGGF